jgi:branched-chain amino acid transport system ATP-binding protein
VHARRGTAVLSAHGVSVRFGGITALEDVSVEVGRGEVLGVIGPNGAGKTTLFNVICGFVPPSAGTLSWNDRTLVGIRPHDLSRLGIVRTLQAVGLFEHLTALENVMVGAQRFRRGSWLGGLLGTLGADRDERALQARAETALAALDCGQIAHRRPGTLPFAVQKKVALARALVAEPELLLLDEPAGGLSHADLSELRELIAGLRREMSVMLVEHHMDLVMSVCDRVVVLDFGRVVAHGSPDEIRRDPHVLDAYLGREAGEGDLSEEEAFDAGR